MLKLSQTHDDSVQDLKKDFDEAITGLKSAIIQIVDAIETKRPYNSISNNPEFEHKLAIHRSLLSLIEEQKNLSEGIIVLLQKIDQYATQRVRRPPLPPPPRPAPEQMTSRYSTQTFI